MTNTREQVKQIVDVHYVKGQLNMARKQRDEEIEKLRKLRADLRKRADRLLETARECKESGCEDWPQHMRAAMEVYEGLGFSEKWSECYRALQTRGCPGCGHERPINSNLYEVCDECVEHQFS